MEFREVSTFLESTHRGVVTTFQPNGVVQVSIVVCGVYQHGLTFVAVSGRSAKVRNLRRDPRCTVLVVADDWSRYVVVEGRAILFDSNNTESKELRRLLRDIYCVCATKEHPNWEEYDSVMESQNAAVISIHPERIYGLLR